MPRGIATFVLVSSPGSKASGVGVRAHQEDGDCCAAAAADLFAFPSSLFALEN